MIHCHWWFEIFLHMLCTCVCSIARIRVAPTCKATVHLKTMNNLCIAYTLSHPEEWGQPWASRIHAARWRILYHLNASILLLLSFLNVWLWKHTQTHKLRRNSRWRHGRSQGETGMVLHHAGENNVLFGICWWKYKNKVCRSRYTPHSCVECECACIRVSVLAFLRFIDPMNRSFDPQEIGKHGIKGSIIALITTHHIHVSKLVKILIFLTPWFQTLAPTLACIEHYF